MAGHINLHRDAFDHPLLRDGDRFRAWFWMVSKACWKPTQFDVGGRLTTLQRGQFCCSVREMAEAWNWSKSSVDRFLTRLKTESMIGTVSGTGRLIITICNYDKYQTRDQEGGTPVGTPSGTAAGQQRDTKEEGNNSVPNGTGEDASPKPIDLKAMVFASGRMILKAGGVDDRQAGSIIGKWRKQCNDDDSVLLGVLAACQEKGPASPVEWMTKALQHRNGKPGNGPGSGWGKPASQRDFLDVMAEKYGIGEGV